ncbi:MAG: FAD-dependent oxidoreductase [Dehalococcoidia bacterium]|nr:FAD-dependent oxidoreductase [Dehalococcoidia bacterium]
MSEVVFSSWGGQIVDNRNGQSTVDCDVQVPLKCGSNVIDAFMSWDGLVINDKNINVVALARAYIKEAAKLACGECSMGYSGFQLISGLLQRITEGHGHEGDVELLHELVDAVQKNVKCDYCANAVAPLKDAIKNYRVAFDNAAANTEPIPPVEYVKRVTAPCQEACPIHQDIPGYIELIRNHRYDEALKVIKRANCLPGVTGRTCVAFCEKNCVRADYDSALSVRALKRVPSDLGKQKPQASAIEPKTDKVAIVGAGPAGLSAAQHLAKLGYVVEVFDDQPIPGGMTFAGIPAYRLPRSVLQNDADAIAALGVRFHPNSRVSQLEDLNAQFAAVLLASGAHVSRDSGIDNWEPNLNGLTEGVKFLRDISTGKAIASKNKVLVIGGGNTAIDCARSALRIGCHDVTIVYRRSRSEMPANDDEVEAAEKEGVKFVFLAVPVKILALNNELIGAECIRMELGEPDSSGRRKPVPMAGSEFTLAADMVLTAIGELADTSILPINKVELTDWNSIKADKHGKTSLPWLFAAGDCSSGPASVVEAMAAGKRAAMGIHGYLSKQSIVSCEDGQLCGGFHEIGLSRRRHGSVVVPKNRQYPNEKPVSERILGFEEVEECFDVQAASREAERCLRCYRVMLIVKRQG